MFNYGLAVFVSLSLISSTSAYTLNTTYNSVNNGQIINPAGLLAVLQPTDSCIKQYVSNIDCNPILFDLVFNPANSLPNNTALSQACTNTCQQSLAGWILKTYQECGTGQNQAVTNYFNQTSADQTMLRYYRALCTRDLNNGTFCQTERNPVDIETVNLSKYSQQQIDTACQDTCFTQRSALLWKTYGEVNNTAGVTVADVSKICPKVDTSGYAVTAPLAQLAAGDTPSGTSSAGPSSTSGSSTRTSSTTASSTNTSPSASTTGKSDASTLITSTFMFLPMFIAALAMF